MPSETKVCVCVHLYACMRVGVLCKPAPHTPSPVLFQHKRGSPFKMFLYSLPPTAPSRLFHWCLLLSQPSECLSFCIASQQTGEYSRSLNDLFFSALPLSYNLRSIFTELNLNHRLIYASHTQVVPLPRPMQVKTMKPGWEWAARGLDSLPPVIASDHFLQRMVLRSALA